MKMDGMKSGLRQSVSGKVAIIGAGASGLCAARYFKEAGFDVTIYEVGTQIGGLWCFGNDSGLSSAYKTLHINTAKNLTNFSDFPFPEGTQPFPDHRDMHAYFTRFVDHFGLGPLIRFASRVTSVRADPAPWRGSRPVGRRDRQGRSRDIRHCRRRERPSEQSASR
jgi:cation diffusion facilitator CzcD-associated flavoprotein CzcO